MQPFRVSSLAGMAGSRMQEGGQVAPLSIKAVGPDFHFLCFCASKAEVGYTKVSKHYTVQNIWSNVWSASYGPL